MMFETLAINAAEVDADDMKDLAELTGKLMRHCLACHEAFTVNHS
jgi:hypothetical protein